MSDPTSTEPEVQHFIALFGGLRGTTTATGNEATGGRVVRTGAPWDPIEDPAGGPSWYRVGPEVAEAWDGDAGAAEAGQDMHDLLVELGRTVSLPPGMHERVVRTTESWRRETGYPVSSAVPGEPTDA